MGTRSLESGSRAAVLGGVTAVFEMPNTEPVTTDAEALARTLECAILPPLAVRVIGEITPDKVRMAREASAIVEEELEAAGLVLDTDFDIGDGQADGAWFTRAI